MLFKNYITNKNYNTNKKSRKAVDIEQIDLWKYEDKDLETHFKPLDFWLVTTEKTYGPFGSSKLNSRKPITIPIEDGDVLAQVTNYFIYPNEYNEPIFYTNKKCFSFYVS